MPKCTSCFRCATCITIVVCSALLAMSIFAVMVLDTVPEAPKLLPSVVSRGHAVEFLSRAPRVLLHHDFLSTEECDHIVGMAANDVTRSGVTGDGGKVLYTDYRTSYGSFISKHMNDSVIVALLERIEKWTMIPTSHGETFYLLRYDPGQEYKAHTDWFAPNPNGLEFLGPAGNRLATLIVYLSDVEEGGETTFPNINMKVRPQKGAALLFWNRTPDGVLDPLVLHSSLPVIRGRKWSITRWIRERPIRP